MVPTRGALHYILQGTSSCRTFLCLLFIMLHKVVLTFESVDEILECDHLNETY